MRSRSSSGERRATSSLAKDPAAISCPASRARRTLSGKARAIASGTANVAFTPRAFRQSMSQSPETERPHTVWAKAIAASSMPSAPAGTP